MKQGALGALETQLTGLVPRVAVLPAQPFLNEDILPVIFVIANQVAEPAGKLPRTPADIAPRLGSLTLQMIA